MSETDARLRRSEAPIVKAIDIACVLFNRTDLDLVERFCTDFGLTRPTRTGNSLMMYAAGGYGPAYIAYKASKSGFLGIGLKVRDMADLERLRDQAGASAIEPAEGYPDGFQVRLTDPAGREVRAIHGPAPDMPEIRRSMKQNLDDNRDRVNEWQRPPLRPSTLLRLGHAVLNSVDFFTVARWYMDTFGLLGSDIQTLSDGDPALIFLRCDRVDHPVDHHTVVVAQFIENGIGHSSFEALDLDDIAMGQQHLLGGGWKHAWGVGRHELGSQIFDYWRDPFGDKMEHFCDSDLLTSEMEPGVSELTIESLYQWGPDTPKDFEAPKITPGLIYRMFRNVQKSDELTFSRLRKLMGIGSGKPRPWA